MVRTSIPTVSVVVPNYNHAHLLRQRIDTILAQTFQDFELILLDDCSIDDSRSILSTYSTDARVKTCFNDANSGSTFKQWNKGVELARGKYVWIAESDDYADEHLLERLVPLLEADPDVAYAYCRSWRVNESGVVNGFGDWYLELVDCERWKTDFCISGRDEFLDYLACACVVPNASAAVFRKDLYDRAGGADESFRVCGDWKVWSAMALEGKVAFIAEPLNYYRFHEGSVLHKSRAGAQDSIESLKVVRWILNQKRLPESVQGKMYRLQASRWVPALLSTHNSLAQKLAILRGARAIDPHPVSRMLVPALSTIRMKVLRHWRSLQGGATVKARS